MNRGVARREMEGEIIRSVDRSASVGRRRRRSGCPPGWSASTSAGSFVAACYLAQVEARPADCGEEYA